MASAQQANDTLPVISNRNSFVFRFKIDEITIATSLTSSIESGAQDYQLTGRLSLCDDPFGESDDTDVLQLMIWHLELLREVALDGFFVEPQWLSSGRSGRTA